MAKIHLSSPNVENLQHFNGINPYCSNQIFQFLSNMPNNTKVMVLHFIHMLPRGADPAFVKEVPSSRSQKLLM